MTTANGRAIASPADAPRVFFRYTGGASFVAELAVDIPWNDAMALNRREFLKATGAVSLSAMHPPLRAAEETADDAIPPHRPLDLVGVHAYADAESVHAGETIHFHVSATEPYELSVCRLGTAVDDPSSDEVLHTFPRASPTPQPIHPGSYVHVEKPLPATQRLDAITLECWVRPWSLGRAQGLLTEHTYPSHCGVGLFIDDAGRPTFYLGDGGSFADRGHHAGPKDVLHASRWHHVVGSWDGAHKRLWVDGEEVGRWRFDGPVKAGPASLRIGAYGEDGVADHFLDGDVAMPAVYAAALSPEAIRRRHDDKALSAPDTASLLACWPLDEEKGSRVADASGHERHGRIINHGTWMVGGPSFDPAVDRYGDYDPAEDPTRGHGLRLAHDDLYDCRWRPTHTFAVPRDARPGMCVGRIRFEQDGRARLYHVTFLVKRHKDRPKAPVLLLCATNTYRAYGGTPFGVTRPGVGHYWGTHGTRNTAGNPPAYCFYREHASGQGTYQVGLRIPWPAAGPYVLYSDEEMGYSHLARADRFTQVWLEREGYSYDIVGDLDLHRDPSLLDGYRTLIINGHSEYWSARAYDGVDRYLRNGGNVACLSGNTMFWRVSFDEDHAVMECRKVDALGGNQMPPSRRGEAWHSHDGERGGLMRECGYPAWKVVGLEMQGLVDRDHFTPYRVVDADHFLFRRPTDLGVEEGDRIGEAPDGGPPKANGHEVDVRLSTLRALAVGPPPAAREHPEEPDGITTVARGLLEKPSRSYDYFVRRAEPKQTADMIWWERPSGGRVFHAGTIAFGWALSADAKLAGLLRNVLHELGVDPGASEEEGADEQSSKAGA